MVFIKLGRYEEAVADCERVMAWCGVTLRDDPWATPARSCEVLDKVMYRCCVALKGLKNYKKSLLIARRLAGYCRICLERPVPKDIVALVEGLYDDMVRRGEYDREQREEDFCLFAKQIHQILPLSLCHRGMRQSFVCPSKDSVQENLLMVFHGFGDVHEKFIHLFEALSLPQTAGLILKGPYCLPEELADTSDPDWMNRRAWVNDFNDSIAYPPVDGTTPSIAGTRSYNRTLDGIMELIQVLRVHFGWDTRKIHLFGFSQGGSIAAGVAIRAAAELQRPPKSCISISGPVIPKSVRILADSGATKGMDGPTLPVAVLLTWGEQDQALKLPYMTDTASYLEQHGCSVTFNQIKNKGHAMIGSKEETAILMKFWASHLSVCPQATNRDASIIELK